MEIISGRKLKPFTIVLCGTPGIGKTTFASGAPAPIFIGAENNDELESDRLPIPKSWDEFLAQIRHVSTQKNRWKTLVVDTVDSVDLLLTKKILDQDKSQSRSMQKAHGGYGVARDLAQQEMINVRNMLQAIRDEQGMNILILAHTSKTNVEDTVMGMAYSSYELNLHHKVQSVWVDWVACVLFANFVARRQKDETNRSKIFAMGDGERVVFTEKRPGHIGKNRYNLPFEMPLDFEFFYQKYLDFYNQKKRSEEEIRSNILAMSANIKDPERKEKVLNSIKSADVKKLEQIEGRLKELSL